VGLSNKNVFSNRNVFCNFSVSTEDDQIKIEQLTRELVDIVEQRNTLVELLEHDRKRYLLLLVFRYIISNQHAHML
jgi:hypothetical protein